MRSLSDTLERLARFRKDKSGHAATARSRLSRLQRFGSNPGALQAWYHVPVGLKESPALVVVLHGCTQNAAGYDHASGWSKIAEDFGFAVLYPEQVPANNPNVCFNWFTPSDIRRGQGEVHSIRQMVETIIVEYGIDRRRVYITGLSAGGAMANAALCAYPEIFTGGAIIAGLPFAAATTVPEAFDRMRGHGIPDVESLRSRLSGASPHAGPWPTISVWHGTNDRTVAEANAKAIIAQWSGVHGVPSNPSSVETVDGHKRLAWRDRSGRDAIELYLIEGYGPWDTTQGRIWLRTHSTIYAGRGNFLYPAHCPLMGPYAVVPPPAGKSWFRTARAATSGCAPITVGSAGRHSGGNRKGTALGGTNALTAPHQ